MAGIRSVTGWVDGADLGYTLVHEHIAASSPGILQSWSSLFGGRERLVSAAVAALLDAKAIGVSTIVDCTTFDAGRDPVLMAEVSRASGVTIIACTGLWLDPSVTLRARTVTQLADWFTADLTAGIDGTTSTAGVIKVATEGSLSGMDTKILEAAAIAGTATNAPIITHTSALNRSGEAQADFLEDHGVDPGRVAIGHSDDSHDVDYLTGLAARGYWISMDRLPHGRLPEYGGQTVQDRADMVVHLIEAGYADRILLSHDDPLWAGLMTDENMVQHQEANPDLLTFISKEFLPLLDKAGVAGDVVRGIIVDNPRRWLTGS